MQTLQTSVGGRSGRDTLSNIFEGVDPTYSATLQMVGNLAQAGLQGASARQAQRQRIADTLASQMALSDMQMQAEDAAAQAAAAEEEDMLGGESDAMISFYESVLNKLHPEDPRRAHVMAQLEAFKANMQGSAARRKGVMKRVDAMGTMNPFAQTELGGVIPETIQIPTGEMHDPHLRPSSKKNNYEEDDSVND